MQQALPQYQVKETLHEALLRAWRLLALAPHRPASRPACPSRRSRSTTRPRPWTARGDYRTVNPLGYVPLLELDDGTRITEGPAIVQWIADKVPGKNLAPANGTHGAHQAAVLAQPRDQRAAQGLLAAVQPVDARRGQEDLPRAAGHALCPSRQASRQQRLPDGQETSRWRMPTCSSCRTGRAASTSTSRPHANVLAYRKRVGARPAVQAAMKAEGLIK